MHKERKKFEFRNPEGKLDDRFTAMTDEITEAQSAYASARIAPHENRRKLVVDARETLAKMGAGRFRQSPATELQTRKEFRMRPFDGREWPLVTTRDGESDWPSGMILDPKRLGNYFEWNIYATGNGEFLANDCYCDIESSRMGGYIRAINWSSDNDDNLIGHVEGGFWFSYTPTRDCLLSVNGMAIQTYSRQFRDLADEGSFFAPQISNVQISQQNFLTVGYFIDGPGSQVYGRSMAEVGPGSSYYGDGDHANEVWGWGDSWSASGFPDVDELVRNGERTIEFAYRPAVRVQPNVPVHCFIGARSAIDAHLDDVKASIRQGASWHLRRLSVWEV